MPAKMAKLCQKAVLVSIYVERPTKRMFLSNSSHHPCHDRCHHHHHHHCSYVHGDRTAGKGYNRRAELLLYSRRLRESVRPSETSRLDPKPSSSIILQPTANVAADQKKPKDNKTPKCLGNLKILNLNFCRSLTSVQIKKEKKKKKQNKSMISVMKSLEVRKKRGFASKFRSMLQKHRQSFSRF